MPALDPRQMAERVAAIFRARQPIDILPAELIPADLETAYRIRAAYEAIEAPRRGALAGYKIGLTTPIMQQLCGVDEPCYGAMFSSEIRQSPRRGAGRRLLPASASRPRSRCGSARICRKAAVATGWPRRSKAAWRRSRCSRICATTTSG